MAYAYAAPAVQGRSYQECTVVQISDGSYRSEDNRRASMMAKKEGGCAAVLQVGLAPTAASRPGSSHSAALRTQVRIQPRTMKSKLP